MTFIIDVVDERSKTFDGVDIPDTVFVVAPLASYVTLIHIPLSTPVIAVLTPPLCPATNAIPQSS